MYNLIKLVIILTSEYFCLMEYWVHVLKWVLSLDKLASLVEMRYVLSVVSIEC